jgi:hypothetical protein
MRAKAKGIEISHLVNEVLPENMRAGTASIVRGVWTAQSVHISAFAGQSVRIRVEAADAGSASFIEAGFDNVTVTRQ